MLNEHRLFQQPWPEGEYRFFQLGFVVDDVIAAARRWVDLYGVGPFHVMPRNNLDCTYRGQPARMDTQIAVAQAGPVQIELIAVFDDGPNVFADMLGAGGAGFHQICTTTPDFDGKKAHYAALGIEPACEVSGRGLRVAYYDTVDEVGFFTEVVEQTPEFLAQLAAVAGTCANWDGSEPIRLLTRDGYTTP